MAELLWHTSVTSLMAIFRDALTVLLPVFNRAHIRWEDSLSYDDFDEIATTLYRNIVVRSLNYSQELTDSQFCRYDLIEPSYHDRNFIQVDVDCGISNGHAAFLGFSSREAPFDHVKAVVVDQQGHKLQGDEVVCLPFASCSFRAFVRRGQGNYDLISALRVQT